MKVSAVLAVIAILLLVTILWDVFETIILPRRVTRRFRLARLFYMSTWRPWRVVASSMKPGNRRESFLSYFGPLSLLVLFGVWALGLIVSFALLHLAAGSAINLPGMPGDHPGFWPDLYMSGTTFFTLGLGDVTPRTSIARFITVLEAGIGFGFLALAISYLPVLYGAFSRREVNISLLDARAGSPPTAAELLKRHAQPQSLPALEQYLRDWESWAAELMESHLSYPVLCYFRSQHNNQSWLAALATILDVSALLVAFGQGALKWQARMTFAISRHAVVDLAQVLKCAPQAPAEARLSDGDLEKLLKLTEAAGVPKCAKENAQTLTNLRAMYEPYIAALSDRLLMYVAPWSLQAKPADNWRTSAWARISAEKDPSLISENEEREHF
jgi:hypothetical protein